MTIQEETEQAAMTQNTIKFMLNAQDWLTLHGEEIKKLKERQRNQNIAIVLILIVVLILCYKVGNKKA
jgi:hypothetical protein